MSFCCGRYSFAAAEAINSKADDQSYTKCRHAGRDRPQPKREHGSVHEMWLSPMRAHRAEGGDAECAQTNA